MSRNAAILTLSATVAAGGGWGAFHAYDRHHAPAVRAIATATDSAGVWDQRTVDELHQEGIELGDLNEIRRCMRLALTDPDAAVRTASAAALKRRFGLDADPALLARLEAIDGSPALSLTDRGRQVVQAVVGAVGRAYDGLLRLVD